MFTTIFKFELAHWFRQPSTYIYAAIFFIVSLISMAGNAGIWDAQTNAVTSVWMANAPSKINEMYIFLMRLVLFLLPAIIGVSVYRDYQQNMHAVLYSYPFKKAGYLFAKFLSSFLVVSLIVACIGLGLFIGTQLPGINTAQLGPFQSAAYLQPYFIYALPNILLFGAIVFGVVTFSRNIYAGFITIVLLLFLQGAINGLLGTLDNRFWAAILDPFGTNASNYYSRYWTVSEYNELLLPVKSVVIYNRVLWLSIAVAIFALVYKSFRFSQKAISFFKNKPKKQAGNKVIIGSVAKINLPNVTYGFSLSRQLKNCWQLSGVDFNYILKSWMFLSIVVAGFLFIAFQQAEMNPAFGFKIYPYTWKMLRVPAFLFLGVIHILTFLFAGMLIQRARLANMHQLLDITPVPNWVLLFSKFLALLKMQAFLLLLVVAGGLLVQSMNGFYNFDIGLYFFHLYGVIFIGIIIWTFVALAVQTLFTNPYLGLFLLILGVMGISGLPELGIEQYVFRYNAGPEYAYSDMDGYGTTLPPYFLYKFYWSLFGSCLLIVSLLFWVRGLPQNLWERIKIAAHRLNGIPAMALLLLLTLFVGLGFQIYRNDQLRFDGVSTKSAEDAWKAAHEKRYKKFEGMAQPRKVSINIEMDIYPETHDFKSRGVFILINKAQNPIDTLLVNYNFKTQTSYNFDQPFSVIVKDSLHRFDILRLQKSLQPGDSLKMMFEVQNQPNTFFDKCALIKNNGTFFTNNIFPGFGYQPFELGNHAKRATFGLPPKIIDKPHPSDSLALANSYSSKDADWLEFEATVSTSPDQLAIAPGYLQKEWTANGRRYFHYKMDGKIKDYYGFNSGRFEVARDKLNDVDLEIYCQKGHTYNLDRMMNGLKAGLAYNAAHFSPYQHKQARIIEFPMTLGRYATTFANSIPFSELYFMMELDDTNEDNFDLPFYVTAHEIAHQWWGNQLIPADVQGARMLTESMAEYSALKVLEKEYGKQHMRKFLKMDLDQYLKGRGGESRAERPLMLAKETQEYITYRKGALVMYALSDYIGANNFNAAIKKYLLKVQFQDAPYTTSLEMLEYIRAAVPDSLKYLVHDMFETITLYDNKIESVQTTQLPDGKYQMKINFVISKFRADEKSNSQFSDNGIDSLSYQIPGEQNPMHSLPLADYIEVGIFGEPLEDGMEKTLYLMKHKITKIQNSITITLSEKPMQVGIDPFNKLIDRMPWDNRERLH